MILKRWYRQIFEKNFLGVKKNVFCCQKLQFFKKFNKIVNFSSLKSHNTSFWWIFPWEMSFPSVRFAINSFFSVLGVKKWLFFVRKLAFFKKFKKIANFYTLNHHNTSFWWVFPWEMPFPSVRFDINSFFLFWG